MKKNPNGPNSNIGVIILVVIVLLFGGVVFLVNRNQGETKNGPSPSASSLFSQPNPSPTAGSGKYQDTTCHVSFDVPKNWAKSDLQLPLIPPPVSQVTFDEPGSGTTAPKKSIFSFICYDGTKYSQERFLSDLGATQNSGETLTVGTDSWNRQGNYFYTTKNGKLLVLQMFFTKYDFQPSSAYETIFQQILNSVTL